MSSHKGFALEQILEQYPRWTPSHYRTATGVELDLILEKGRRRLAFEFKASSAPDLTRGFHQAIADLQPEHTYIVAPIEQPYPIGKNLTIRPPHSCQKS